MSNMKIDVIAISILCNLVFINKIIHCPSSLKFDVILNLFFRNELCSFEIVRGRSNLALETRLLISRWRRYNCVALAEAG